MTNLRNAHTILLKMQSLLEQMEEHPGLNTRLERDLMLSYNRRLYEEFLNLQVGEKAQSMQVEDKIYRPIANVVEAKIEEIPVVEPEMVVAEPIEVLEEAEIVQEEIPATKMPTIEEEIIVEEQPEAIQEAMAVAESQISMPLQPKRVDIFSFEPVSSEIEELAVEEEIKPIEVDEIPIEPQSEPIPTVPNLNFYPAHHQALYDLQDSGLLVEKFNSIPITDLYKAWGLNDKILTINTLFDGSVQAFESTLNSLNQVRNFDEAKQFLSQYVIEKFDWTKSTRLDKAQQFLRTIRRRYM
ncbi:MAG: hypothetical protein ABIV51_06985 [Saprospiraceae bacterium]